MRKGRRDWFPQKHTENRFPVDPTLEEQHRKFGGTPPAGHPRRCQSWNRLGNQCGQWATPGRRFCRFHGGHLPLGNRMAGRYTRGVSTTLKQRLEELSAESVQERVSLAEEIDVARLLAERAVKIYDAVVLAEDSTASPEIKANASSVVQSSLDAVAKLVEKFARVDALMKDKIPAHQIDFILLQVGQALDKGLDRLKTFGVDPNLIEGIKKDIHQEIENIQVPRDESVQPRVVLALGD